jgi:hypothetical protein
MRLPRPVASDLVRALNLLNSVARRAGVTPEMALADPDAAYSKLIEAMEPEPVEPHSAPEPPATLPDSPPVTPPAPLLVGIEPNPGPPLSTSSIAVEVARGFGAALAKSQKDKRKPKQKKKATVTRAARRSRQLMGSPQVRTLSMPSSVGTQVSSSGLTHKPFVVSGKVYAGQLGSSSIGAARIFSGNTVDTGGNAVTIDPTKTGNAPTNCMLFGLTAANIALSFQNYRFRKLLLHYVPLSATTDAHNLTVCATSEVVFGPISQGAVYSISDCTLTTSTFLPASMDLMRGGIRSDWLFCDDDVTTTESDLRQESPGSILFTYGGAAVNSAVFGQIWLEYELEFDRLAITTGITARRKRIDAASSSTPITTIAQPESEEHKESFVKL